MLYFTGNIQAPTCYFFGVPNPLMSHTQTCNASLTLGEGHHGNHTSHCWGHTAEGSVWSCLVPQQKLQKCWKKSPVIRKGSHSNFMFLTVLSLLISFLCMVTEGINSQTSLAHSGVDLWERKYLEKYLCFVCRLCSINCNHSAHRMSCNISTSSARFLPQ